MYVCWTFSILSLEIILRLMISLETYWTFVRNLLEIFWKFVSDFFFKFVRHWCNTGLIVNVLGIIG